MDGSRQIRSFFRRDRRERFLTIHSGRWGIAPPSELIKPCLSDCAFPLTGLDFNPLFQSFAGEAFRDADASEPGGMAMIRPSGQRIKPTNSPGQSQTRKGSPPEVDRTRNMDAQRDPKVRYSRESPSSSQDCPKS